MSNKSLCILSLRQTKLNQKHFFLLVNSSLGLRLLYIHFRSFFFENGEKSKQITWPYPVTFIVVNLTITIYVVWLLCSCSCAHYISNTIRFLLQVHIVCVICQDVFFFTLSSVTPKNASYVYNHCIKSKNDTDTVGRTFLKRSSDCTSYHKKQWFTIIYS